MTSRTAAWVWFVVAATAIAWCGFFIHNIADLPGQTIASPETALPTLMWIAGLILWLIPATRAIGAWILLAWAVINLVGGAISVLPLPFLPFQPAQTIEHYAFHGLYAATQLPLIAATAAWLIRRTLTHEQPSAAARGTQAPRR